MEKHDIGFHFLLDRFVTFRDVLRRAGSPGKDREIMAYISGLHRVPCDPAQFETFLAVDQLLSLTNQDRAITLEEERALVRAFTNPEVGVKRSRTPSTPTTTSPPSPRREKRRKIIQYSDSEDEEDDDDDYVASDHNDSTCATCGELGEILCCDGCPNAYHLACLSPPLLKVPSSEKWFCDECSGN